MITYVNTVFVSNSATAAVESAIPTAADAASKKGNFVILNVDTGEVTDDPVTDGATRIKIGIITGKTMSDHKGEKAAQIRWSNVINKADVKAVSVLTAPATTDTEDTITIDFAGNGSTTGVDAAVLSKWAEGGKRVIVRLTFKDLPTRFRKWTESYEYVTQIGDGATEVANGLGALITKQWKRARVEVDGQFTNGVFATTTNGVLKLTAMPYDDDNSVDTINWANKVRFNANVYYTDPAAEGWESLNKHYPKGLVIDKEPGFRYAADAKLVRDRESQALGYLGILNRGEGTWPIIKPEMETDLSAKYDCVTLEFENMYRAADDIFRKTKQTVEIYVKTGVTESDTTTGGAGAIADVLTAFVNADRTIIDDQTEDGQED